MFTRILCWPTKKHKYRYFISNDICMNIIYFFWALCIPLWEMFVNLKKKTRSLQDLSFYTHKKLKKSDNRVKYHKCNNKITLTKDKKTSRIGSSFSDLHYDSRSELHDWIQSWNCEIQITHFQILSLEYST